MKSNLVLTLQHKKRGHLELFYQVVQDVVGKPLKWSQIQELEEGTLRLLIYELEDRLLLEQSPIDIPRLAQSIQYARSGIGGSAMTAFTCAFCGKEEWWGNTAVPRICKACATNMATQIAKYHSDILKKRKEG